MTKTYVNRHGRQWGRGVRPMLLIPKVLAVGMLFGGLCAMAAIAFGEPLGAGAPLADRLRALGRLFYYVVLPGAGVSLFCGWALMLQHFAVMLRQRWVWAKAISGWLLVGALFVVWRLIRLEAWAEVADRGAQMQTLRWSIAAAIAATALVVFFGRHKPRLGQPYGKAGAQKGAKPQAAVVGVALLLGVTGCGGVKVDQLDRDAVPAVMALEFNVDTTDGRSSLFRVDDEGVFYFGGGMTARYGATQEVARLTEDQRRAIWQLVVDRDLMAARGTFLGKPQRVRYILRLNTSAGNHDFHAIDDEVAGLDELNKLLFGYQADLRYGEVLRPIEIELEKKKAASKR